MARVILFALTEAVRQEDMPPRRRGKLAKVRQKESVIVCLEEKNNSPDSTYYNSYLSKTKCVDVLSLDL